MARSKPTPAEQEVLDLLLSEMRYAVAKRGQLNLTFDPWLDGTGANVFASHGAPGFSCTIQGRFKAHPVRAKKGRRR